ncbi:NAD(P)-dependent oxidoreductase [Maritimibacter sp. HL-12]|uniref:NAD(P)-dependent oxidoreductase n=1 Tax=Maritimibacter sp. HL-12 TaxID=1162418 RepID=UPI000A0EF2C5|nr:NAD(P)-dependent oxidoreductase [Maritimibacter sp. HL-12]SMH28780.1 3-hydroxyisobutyrate dehydrogenase [Maritimibacter sp. HL-12]
MPPSIAIIGYGEVGQIWAEALRAGGAPVATYDILFGQPVAAARVARAGDLGVRIAANAADAADGAQIVISAVTADQARAVAEEAAGYLRPGQTFFCINSAAPETKIAAAAAITPSGAHFVEGAVMATVPGPGLGVPILGGGVHAPDLAAKLNPLGMNITPVAGGTGRASAMKLCRSIVIKGLEAIMIQSRESARHWDVEAEVFASLARSYPGMDWPELAEKMHGRVVLHGRRRSAEMREAAAMTDAIGLGDSLCRGIADVQAAFAGKK